MSNATDYLEGELIRHLFRTGSMTKPAQLHIGLFTAPPNDAGAGGTEVSGGSYARVQVNPGDANWSAPAGGNGTTSNVGTITFPTPTAPWGIVTHFGVFDAATGGNLLIAAALQVAKTIETGDGVPFPPGSLTVTIA